MKIHLSPRIGVYALFLTIGSFFLGTKASAQDRFYYWVSGGGGSVLGVANCGQDSFVIEVDAAKKADIERFWAEKKTPQFHGHIAAGPVDYNRDYHAPGHPVWDWHVVSVDEIVQLPTLHDASIQPPRNGSACDIASNPDDWIRKYGDQIGLEHYFIMQQIDPNSHDAVANVSNRGVAGSGERRLITGLIVTGGTPRNLVMRALGPSLTTAGVQQAVTNPKIEVYHGSTRIAANADWKTDARATSLAQNFPSLAPTNEKEAAVWLTLLPGTYTLQGISEDGTEGVMLLEAYDVDSATP
jgi:hypothetical protein